MIIYYSTDISDSIVLLVDDEHRHCSKVTRKKAGDQVWVTDGLGKLYQCELITSNRHETQLQIINEEETKPLPYDLAIAIAPTKNNSRLEWFLEKATEIGVSEIYPILTKRGERQHLKMDRLEKIIISAMKQSKNLYLPKLHKALEWSSFLQGTSSYDFKGIAHCADVEQHLSTFLNKNSQRMVLCIGPEGDFTDEEIQESQEHGFQEVNLGRSRLRTETAGIVACSIVAQAFI